MKRTQIVRAIGWTQIGLGALLAIASLTTFILYRSSLGDMTSSLVSSMRSASDAMTAVAGVLESRQGLLDDTTHLLADSRKLVEAAKMAATNQEKALPAYVEGLKSASQSATVLANTLAGLGEQLMFSVPTAVQMDGIKPVLVWTSPLEVTATKVKAQAQDVRSISNGLSVLVNTLGGDGGRLTESFLETCSATLALIDSATQAAIQLKGQGLPQAIAMLTDASENLRLAKVQASKIDRFVWALLVVTVLLAASFMMQGVGLLLQPEYPRHSEVEAAAL